MIGPGCGIEPQCPISKDERSRNSNCHSVSNVRARLTTSSPLLEETPLRGPRLLLLSLRVTAAVIAFAGLVPDDPGAAHALPADELGRIVFTSDRTGNFEIFVMSPDGAGLTQLTDDPAEDREPAWSPDGTKIVFTRVIDGNAEIFLMDADGTGPVPAGRGAGGL